MRHSLWLRLRCPYPHDCGRSGGRRSTSDALDFGAFGQAAAKSTERGHRRFVVFFGALCRAIASYQVRTALHRCRAAPDQRGPTDASLQVDLMCLGVAKGTLVKSMLKLSALIALVACVGLAGASTVNAPSVAQPSANAAQIAINPQPLPPRHGTTRTAWTPQPTCRPPAERICYPNGRCFCI